MQDKIYVLFAYALIGLIIGLFPLLLSPKGATNLAFPIATIRFKSPFFRKALFGLLAGIVAIKLLVLSGFPFLLIVLFGTISSAAVLQPKKRHYSDQNATSNSVFILSAFAFICIAGTLPWWRRNSGVLILSFSDIFLFGIVTIIVAHLLANHVMKPNDQSEGKFPVNWVVGYCVIAAILSFSIGIFADHNSSLWHHWSAYISPAELLLAGAELFRDFPAQYGLGPTAILAIICGNDCWNGMYFFAGFSTFAFSVIVFIMAIRFAHDQWWTKIILLVLSIATCFFWTAYPPNLTSALQTPSVSGMRFLPSALLTVYLFFSIRIEESRLRVIVAHMLWVLGAMWSPESAFYVTFIWWPFYLFIKRGEGDFTARFKNTARSALVLVLIAIALVLSVCVGFQIIYGQWPTLYGVLAYAINPPGPLPIDSSGAVWFFVATVAIGLGAMWRSWKTCGDTQHFRRGFLVVLLAYAVFSYFLGRSHENNLMNIMPFMMLILIFASSTLKADVLARGSSLMLASLLGWMTLFGWNGWKENIVEGRLFNFGSSTLISTMPFHSDALHAVNVLHNRYGESVTILDGQMSIVRAVPPTPWSAIHGPANYGFIPSKRRQEFLINTAKSLKRPGWLVVYRQGQFDDWIADFDAAYDRTDRLEFGMYYAIRFKPKLVD